MARGVVDAAAAGVMAVAVAVFAFAAGASSVGSIGDVAKKLSFEEGYTPLFGFNNVVRSADDRNVRILLDRSTGSGFISSAMYRHGFFSASIKLPGDYTAGVVVAFYASNGDVFDKTHDELDFEFLGNIRGRPWRVQTNVYGNGSVSRGREERYSLPFDPAADFHRYSILWTADNIIFYIDDSPVREVRRSAAMGGDFPAKPMAVYATIWDASTWATNGGRYKVDYRYSPFVAEFTDLSLLGCRVDPIEMLPASGESCADDDDDLIATGLSVMSPARHQAMHDFRVKYMSYSYCYDTVRYPAAFPECDYVEAEKERLTETGHLRPSLRRRSRRAKSRAG